MDILTRVLPRRVPAPAHRPAAWLLGGIMACVLAACGGGGGGVPSEPTTVADATVSAATPSGAADAGATDSIKTLQAADATNADATAAALYSVVWADTPGGVSVATDAADNVYSALWDYNPAGDIYVTKRNADGVEQWTVRHDNTDATRHEVATWVGTDSRGNVLVSGTIRSGYSNPVNANSVLMKFSPGGQLLWRRVYDAFFDGSSTRKLVVDESDNVYVLGIGMSPSGLRATVRKFSPDGSTLWAWFDPAGIGTPVNFKWSADGGLVIAARGIYGSVNGYAKINRGGNTVWTLPAIYSLTAGDAAGDAAGNTYLINGVYATGGGSVLRKVGPDAATIWERTHPMAGLRVEVGSDGAPVVGGFPNSGTAGAAFIKFDPAGRLLWANLDADGGSVALLAHAQMRMDALDNVYLAASNMSQMGVTKVRSNGTSAWTALVPFGYAQGMAFGRDGRLFVTGGTVARIDQATDVAPPPPPPPPPPPTPSSADLALGLVDSPDPVRSNSQLVITASINNRGPSAATGVNFGATLPSGVTLLSVVPSKGSCSGSTAIGCAIGTLDSGARATVTITLLVTRKNGTLTTTGSVTAAEPDPDTGNNTASVVTQVTRR